MSFRPVPAEFTSRDLPVRPGSGKVRTMRPHFLLSLALAACVQTPVEAPAPGMAPVETFSLVTLDGAPFPAPATISFPKPGRAAGRAVCNLWSGAQSATPPAFRLEATTMTEMACDGMEWEPVYLSALAAMTRIEQDGPTLTLSNGAGRTMLFRRQP